jgi:hypothetical protein
MLLKTNIFLVKCYKDQYGSKIKDQCYLIKQVENKDNVSHSQPFLPNRVKRT